MIRAFVFVVALVCVMPTPSWAVDVERVVSPGGIEAWLVRDHSNPIVSMRFAFQGGTAQDPQGQSGLANLAATTMDEGAGDLDSKAFQQVLADQSITLRFSASLDTFGGRLQVLSENLDQGTELLKLALIQPRFDDEPVARLKSQIIVGIRAESEEPASLAYNTLFERFFPGHGYALDSDGRIEDVKAISREDLMAFVKTRLARSNLNIGVVGDITPDALGAVLDKVFGDLADHPRVTPLADTVPHATGHIDVVERDIPQSTLVWGHGGVSRDDPDYYPALVMNHVLGAGSFTSRLYQEVREKRGLAYSVGSTLYPLDHAALLVGSVATENARAAESLAVIREEWQRMASGDVAQTEIDDAKTYITGAFPLRFTSTDAIANILVAMQLNDLGLDYLDKRADYIDAVTLDDVKRVAANILRPNQMNVVVVGQPQGIAPTP